MSLSSRISAWDALCAASTVRGLPDLNTLQHQADHTRHTVHRSGFHLYWPGIRLRRAASSACSLAALNSTLTRWRSTFRSTPSRGARFRQHAVERFGQYSKFVMGLPQHVLNSWVMVHRYFGDRQISADTRCSIIARTVTSRLSMMIRPRLPNIGAACCPAGIRAESTSVPRRSPSARIG